MVKSDSRKPRNIDTDRGLREDTTSRSQSFRKDTLVDVRLAVPRCPSSLARVTIAIAVARRIALCMFISMASMVSADDLTLDAGIGHNAPPDDDSPWGIATGAELFAAYPRFNPLLNAAGVRWLRGFYDWQTIQPTRGIWNFESTDQLVANAKENHLRITAGFWYLARWTSADGGTRAFPIKDISYWRDYVSALVSRYHNDIQYWEVWNEFNGSFSRNGTPKIYAKLVTEAYNVAKKVDSSAKIGMSVANFDVRFLDAAIKAGAANHFDYICIHPYEVLATLADGGEIGFLSMAGTLQKMLMVNNQRTDIPLWITEVGVGAPKQASAEKYENQATALAKAYLLSIASGFQRVFWFEARGIAERRGLDFGVIRNDWTLRPSYYALKVLTQVLGPKPKYLGWLDLDDGGYGFLYFGRDEDVLAVWAPANSNHELRFTTAVRVTNMDGVAFVLETNRKFALPATPVLITELPDTLKQQAQDNFNKPFSWGSDYTNTKIVTCSLAETNIDKGLMQIGSRMTIPMTDGEASWRRTDFTLTEGRYVHFRVDPRFVPFTTRDLEITAIVRRSAPDKPAGTNLEYESTGGYVQTSHYQTIPADSDWHELTWKVSDADFVGQWGWNFRLNALGSPGEFDIKEIRVKKRV